MAKNKLTNKQEKFVLGIIGGKSQRDAYKAAYNADNMKDSVVDVKASQLLRRDKIRVRYETLRGKVVDEAEKRAIMSAVDILKEIESIANDDIKNYLEFRTEKVVVGCEDGTPIYDYRAIVDLKDSRGINTKNISEVSVGANGTFRFKMYCRDTALYKMAELLGVDVLRSAKQKLAEERFEHEKKIDDKKYW